MDGADGITIALSATTTGLVVKEVLAWLRSRHQKTEIDPTPLPVTGAINMRKDQKYVSTGEFNERMKKVDGDIAAVRNDVSMLRSDINNSNRAVIDKLDEIDKRSEDRAKELYRRIDPLADKTAENAATVAIVKEVFVDTVKSATTGEKK